MYSYLFPGRPRVVRIGLFAPLASMLCLAQAACADQVTHPDPPVAVQPYEGMPSFAEIVEKVLPAVVNITAVHKASVQEQAEESTSSLSTDPSLEEFLRRFFDEVAPLAPKPRGSSARITTLGSGFIVDPAGYIVTDAHVVARADNITVLLQDDSRYPARIVGQDEVSDLALLKIDARKPLPTAAWGDSDAARVGNWILAVGNPFGLGGTVTAGIVSARGRDIRARSSEDFLQIDAPLNRGNSGGPTFNLAGQVIGINTAIYTPSGGSVGIGFAIPSNLARPLIEQLRVQGKIAHGWLGVRLQEVTPKLGQVLGLAKPRGALVVEVIPGAPADAAGIHRGDVIVAFNAHAVETARDLRSTVTASSVGKTASVALWREGKSLTMTVSVGERPQMNATQSSHPPAVFASMGVRFATLTDDLRFELGLDAEAKGVVVAEIDERSLLAHSGIAVGDVIEEINHHTVTTPQAAAARLDEVRSMKEQKVLLLVNRQGSKQYLAWASNAGAKVD